MKINNPLEGIKISKIVLIALGAFVALGQTGGVVKGIAKIVSGSFQLATSLIIIGAIGYAILQMTKTSVAPSLENKKEEEL